MNSDTLICIWILVFPIGIIEVSTARNEVFYFISVPCTITDLLAPETLSYITRGAEWSDVNYVLLTSTKSKKKKNNQLEPENQVRNRLFIDS